MKNIYIYMDDSGKLSKKEKCFSYGGIYFTNLQNRDNFKRLYSSFINSTKCTFCNKLICNHICPEIKSSNTNSKYRRRVINLIKNKDFVNTFSITIYNDEINRKTLSKHSIGRRNDYYQKRIIKEIIINLLNNKILSKDEDINLVINIDDSPRASNGIYNLKESIKEELLYGIENYNYQTFIKPILNCKLNIEVNYVDSKKDYLVQCSDFLVGYINATLIWKEKRSKLKILDTQLFL